MQFSYNKLTDDFELGEIEEGEQEPALLRKFIVNELDYLLLIVGARDCQYLENENRYSLDSEVTSLFPIVSYPMLQFILFMLSFINPYISYHFKFRKDRIHGVHSELFFKIINNIHKKYPIPKIQESKHNSIHMMYNRGFDFYHAETRNLTSNLSSRPFAFITMPKKFLLTDLDGKEKEGDDKDFRYDKLLNGDTQMLWKQSYPSKLRLSRIKDLNFIFKNDILTYLPKFYYNRYNEIFNKIVRAGIKQHTHEFKRTDMVGGITPTDKQKLYFNIDLDKYVVDRYIKNKKRYFEKIGLEIETHRVEFDKLYKKVKIDYDNPVESLEELYEFYLKNILIRRPHKNIINTKANRTNGIYLLHEGVNRLRELLVMEKLNSRDTPKSSIRISSRNIVVHHNKKRTSLKFSSAIDFNNKPCLLSKKIINLVDAIYGKKYELHGLLVYAQIYYRFFNMFGNNIIWFILGTELPEYTGFSYDKFVYNHNNRKYKNTGHTFYRFEKMLEFKGTMKPLFKRLKATGYYHKEKEIREKFFLDSNAG